MEQTLIDGVTVGAAKAFTMGAIGEVTAVAVGTTTLLAGIRSETCGAKVTCLVIGAIEETAVVTAGGAMAAVVGRAGRAVFTGRAVVAGRAVFTGRAVVAGRAVFTGRAVVVIGATGTLSKASLAWEVEGRGFSRGNEGKAVSEAVI